MVADPVACAGSVTSALTPKQSNNRSDGLYTKRCDLCFLPTSMLKPCRTWLDTGRSSHDDEDGHPNLNDGACDRRSDSSQKQGVLRS